MAQDPLAKARQAGISDSDIAQYLAEKLGYGASKLDAARKAGISDTDIAEHLNDQFVNGGIAPGAKALDYPKSAVHSVLGLVGSTLKGAGAGIGMLNDLGERAAGAADDFFMGGHDNSDQVNADIAARRAAGTNQTSIGNDILSGNVFAGPGQDVENVNKNFQIPTDRNTFGKSLVGMAAGLAPILAAPELAPAIFGASGIGDMGDTLDAKGVNKNSPTYDLARLAGGGVNAAAGALDVGAILNKIPLPIQNSILSGLARTGIAAGGGAAAGAAQQLGSNATIKGLVDPNQDLMEGVGQNALMAGLVGGGLHIGAGAVGAAGARKAKSLAADQAETADMELRNAQASEDAAQATQDAAGQAFAAKQASDLLNPPTPLLTDQSQPTIGVLAPRNNPLGLPEEAAQGAAAADQQAAVEPVITRMMNDNRQDVINQITAERPQVGTPEELTSSDHVFGISTPEELGATRPVDGDNVYLRGPSNLGVPDTRYDLSPDAYLGGTQGSALEFHDANQGWRPLADLYHPEPTVPPPAIADPNIVGIPDPHTPETYAAATAHAQEHGFVSPETEDPSKAAAYEAAKEQAEAVGEPIPPKPDTTFGGDALSRLQDQGVLRPVDGGYAPADRVAHSTDPAVEAPPEPTEPIPNGNLEVKEVPVSMTGDRAAYAAVTAERAAQLQDIQDKINASTDPAAKMVLLKQRSAIQNQFGKGPEGRSAWAVVENAPVDPLLGSDQSGDVVQPPQQPASRVVQTFPTKDAADAFVASRQAGDAPSVADQRAIPTPAAGERPAGTLPKLDPAYAQIKPYFDRVLGDKADAIRLKLENAVLDEHDGTYAKGSYTPTQKLISLARNIHSPEHAVDEMMNTGRHEVIHALKDLGVLNDKDVHTMAMEAGRVKWYQKGDNPGFRSYTVAERVAADYPHLQGRALAEEMAAEMNRQWNEQGGKVGSHYRGVMAKVIHALQNLFHYTNAADKLMNRIDTGEQARLAKNRPLTGTYEGQPTHVQYSKGLAKLYSPVSRTIENEDRKSATGNEWLSILENRPGVKAEELDFTGLRDYLKEVGDQRLTKDELQKWTDSNGIRIEEVVKTDRVNTYGDNEELLKDYTPIDYSVEHDAENNHYYVVSTDDGTEIGPFESKAMAEAERRQTLAEDQQAWLVRRKQEEMAGAPRHETYQEEDAKPGSYGNLLLRVPDNGFVKSAHFRERGIIAHVRFNERSVDGNPLLYLEEVQSDLHQDGRKYGYRDPAHAAKVEALRSENDRLINERDANTEAMRKLLQENKHQGADEMYEGTVRHTMEYAINDHEMGMVKFPEDVYTKAKELHAKEQDLTGRMDQNYDAIDRLHDVVPDAPFKKTWPMLAIKRMIAYAIDNGHDTIGFTTGERQTQRWSEKQRKGMEGFYDQILPMEVNKFLKKYGSEVKNAVPDTKDQDWYKTNISEAEKRLEDHEPGSGMYRTIESEIRNAKTAMNEDAVKQQIHTFEITDALKNVYNNAGLPMMAKGSARPSTPEEIRARLAAKAADREAATPQPGTLTNGSKTMETITARRITDRYNIVAEMMTKGAAKVGLPEDVAAHHIDKNLRRIQDTMQPMRRLMSDVRKAHGDFNEIADPIKATDLFPGRSGARVAAAKDTLYRPLYLAMARIGYRDYHLKSLAKVSGLAEQEYEHYKDPAATLFGRLGGRYPAGINERMLGIYMQAKHALERNPWIERVRQTPMHDDEGKPTGEIMKNGSGISNDEAQRILDWFGKSDRFSKMQEAEEKARLVLTDTNRVRLDSGLSPDWTKIDSPLVPQFEHYVPMRGHAPGDREEDVDEPMKALRTGKGFSLQNPEDMHMKGRQTYAGDTVAHIMGQHMEALVRSEKNAVGQSLLNFIRQNADLVKGQLEIREGAPLKPFVDSSTGRVRVQPDPTYKNSPNIMIVKEGGKNVIVDFHNQALADAFMKGNTLGDGFLGNVMRVMMPLTRMYANMATTYNLQFGSGNIIRDVQDAMLNSKQYEPDIAAKIGLHAAENAKALLFGTDPAIRAQYHEMVAQGGMTGVYGLHTVDKIMEETATQVRALDPSQHDYPLKVRLALQKGMSWIEHINDGLEGATRLGVYQSFLEKGYSQPRAAQMAKNLTINFNRKGSVGSELNGLWVFFNANIQSLHSLVQASSAARVRHMIYGLAAAGMIQHIVGSLFSKKDDEGKTAYSKIEPYNLQKNAVFMIPGTAGSYIKMPLAQGYSFFYQMGRGGAAMLMGDSNPLEYGGTLVDTFLNAFNPFGETNPVDAVVPSIARPFFDVRENKSWTGDPIHPDGKLGLVDTPPSETYFSTATPWSKGFSKAVSMMSGGDGRNVPGFVEMYPNSVDYIASSLLGGAGKTVSQIADMMDWAVNAKGREASGDELKVKDIPFLRTVSGNVSDNTMTRNYEATMMPYLQRGMSWENALKTGDTEAAQAMAARDPMMINAFSVARGYEEARIKLGRAIRTIQNTTTMTQDDKIAEIKVLKAEQQKVMMQGLKDMQTTLHPSASN